ncbi:MAG: hypothetical protein Q9187_001693 [Circinaria calcarea]
MPADHNQTIVAPVAAFTMASLLFVYTRTSIKSAKRNAQKHREADGGQINWRNESLRRHGQMEKVEDQAKAGLGEEEIRARKSRRKEGGA